MLKVVANIRAPAADANSRRWACRKPVAVWRGAVSENYVTNSRWTRLHTLRRQEYSSKLWKTQGRLALMGQRCAHPELLDVHLSGVQGRGKHLPPVDDSEYRACAHEMTASVATSTVPKQLPIAEQVGSMLHPGIRCSSSRSGPET